MSRPHYPFVDWMKAVGISVIVYGHVAATTTVPLTPPVYLKQLGVALFLFATGFTLARERRGPAEVLFNRLFQMYLFGLSLAAVITLLGLLTGSGLAPSNYLPFLAGANVLFDNFPANPTTWYVGTYVHFLLLWAVWLRRIRVQRWMVAVAFLVEMPIRGLLIQHAGGFVAYMLLTNWSAVFLLGLARGAEEDTEARGSAFRYAVVLASGLAVWGVAMGSLGFDPTFPFMTLDGWPGAAQAAIASVGASVLYVGTAALLFEVTRRIAAPAPVRFIARNSLIIFLAHMPVYLALHPALVTWQWGYWERVGVQLLVCLPGLGIVSETLRLAIGPDRLRARVFRALMARRRLARQAGVALPS